MSMQKRHIGSLEVSPVGLGCNNFGPRLDGAETARVVAAAIDSGINFFDTADIYGKGRSEEFLGKALGSRRKEVLIATKFGMAMDDKRKGARPEYVRQAAEDSLRRLGTDYMDLYQLHQPDPSVPIEETLGAMDELVREGTVREIGCSNFSAEQIRIAEGISAKGDFARFVSVQNEYSLLHRDPEAEVLAECARVGAAFLPYFPLASGLLTGKYKLGKAAPSGSRLSEPSRSGQLSDSRMAVVEELRQFVEGRNHSLLDLAFSWLLVRPVVASVIAGATKPEQVRQNVAAASWTLTAEEMSEVDRITGAAAVS